SGLQFTYLASRILLDVWTCFSHLLPCCYSAIHWTAQIRSLLNLTTAFCVTVCPINIILLFYTYLRLCLRLCVTEDQTDNIMNTEEAPAPNPNPLTELISAFQAAISPPQPPPSASGSPMALPTLFAGEAAECSGFMLQVQLYIRMQPQQFPTEDSKVAFLTSLLTGKALQWAKAIWNADNPIVNSFEQFTSHFFEVFSTTTSVLPVSDQLFRLQQGSSSVHDYTIHFRTLAAASGWNEI
ncbi:hypothetical protein M9458_010628, partial [Cirrhinus mrigala]